MEHINSVPPVPGIQSSPPHSTAVFKKQTSNSSLSLGHTGPNRPFPHQPPASFLRRKEQQTPKAGCTFSAQFTKIIPVTILPC